MPQVGETVLAKVQVVEEGFRGPGQWVHAEPHDLGVVEARFPGGWYMVRWTRTGTAAQCHLEELARLH